MQFLDSLLALENDLKDDVEGFHARLGAFCHGLGRMDLQGAGALPGRDTPLPQGLRQGCDLKGGVHFHERIALALGLACLGHLKDVVGCCHRVEIRTELGLCAARWDVADHHLGGAEPLKAVRVQAEVLHPSVAMKAPKQLQNCMFGLVVNPEGPST